MSRLKSIRASLASFDAARSEDDKLASLRACHEKIEANRPRERKPLVEKIKCRSCRQQVHKEIEILFAHCDYCIQRMHEFLTMMNGYRRKNKMLSA